MPEGEMRAPRSRLAQRRLRRVPRRRTARRRRQELLRAEALQPLRALAVRPGLPGGRHLREPGRRGAGGQDLLPRLPLLRAGLPVRLPLHRPADAHRGQVHALLPPHHQGPDHGVLRDLPDRGAAARRPQEPRGPDPRVPAHAQGAGAEAADGDRLQGLLQRPRRRRCDRGTDMETILQQVQGFMYPNEVELQWSDPDRALPVHHRAGGRAPSSWPRSSASSTSRRSSRPTAWRCSRRWRSCWWRRCRSSSTSGHPERSSRDVPDAAHHLGDGDVRLRLPLVPDGRCWCSRSGSTTGEDIVLRAALHQGRARDSSTGC